MPIKARSVATVMKRKLLKLFSILLIISALPFIVGFKGADESVYLGGFVTGFDVKLKGAYVLALSNGIYSPSKEAGIVCGDRVMSVNGTEITCAFDISKALKGYKSGSVTVVITHAGETVIKEVTPRVDLSGRCKLGLFVRDGLEGVGTVTFVKTDGTFMSLGHPVSDDDSAVPEVVGGNIYRCSVYGVIKGERGKAGELKGLMTGEKPIGKLVGNYPQGLVGKLNDDFKLENLDKIEVGEGKMGKAELICCVDGMMTKSYSISIVKADLKEKTDKNFVIKVNDKELISLTGGIVQGMSGSPIVQDGKLVGAVTHVFINDCSRGYGISAQNMLKVMK